MKKVLGLVAVATLVASPAGAQSLFATRGLGIPIASVGARARALGGIGTGLLGLEMSFVNPADVAGIGLRGVSASLQPGTAHPDVGGQSGDISAARFPLIRAVYPLGDRGVISVGFGSLLDQSWGVRLVSEETIGDETVPVTDVIKATGSVARMYIGGAYQLSPSFAIGLGGGIHTGGLERRVTRTFEDSTAGLRQFDTSLRWDYGGLFGSAGVRFDVPGVARAGASITMSQKLDITGREVNARNEEADIPMRISAGASGALSSDLMATAGLEWSGGAAGKLFQAGDATALQRNTWRYGGGLEFGGLGRTGRSFPIRLGANLTQLPYYDEGETPGTEKSLALGMGFRLANSTAGPLAVADLALERGSRSGLVSTNLPDGLSERFWRVTFSISLFGN
jgi:hypothetical protein